MYKKIVFGIFITLFISGGIYWYIYFKTIKAPISDGINSIPLNAAFIIESKQSKNTWKKLSQTSNIWKELLSSDVFKRLNEQGFFLDSILQANPSISELLENHSVYISAHLMQQNNCHFLFAYSLPNLTNQSEVEELIEKVNNKNNPTYREFENQKIASVKTSLSTLNYAFINGTLVLSFDEKLIEASIKQIKEGKSLRNDSHFKAILNASGKNVDANIFINYSVFSSILKTFTHSDLHKEIDKLSNFAQYSGWDVTIKPNALMLNGFTYVNDSVNNFLTLFRNQKPQNIEVVNVVPTKISTLLFYGIDDLKKYLADYKIYSKLNGKYADKFIDEQDKKYGIALENSFIEWFDSEMALIVLETNEPDLFENSYAYIHTNDIDEAMLSLNTMADSINKKDKLLTDTLTFQNHFINKLSIPGLIPKLLGAQFNKIETNYFTSIDNYVVFANSIEALQLIISDFENKKTLATNKNYEAFAENISNQSSVYLYSSLARSASLYGSCLNDEQAALFKQKEQLLKKMEAISIQYTSSNKLFYSNVYLKYNPDYKSEAETSWETKLDTTIVEKPTVVINHTTKSKEIFIQDEANKIYLISSTGKILWKKQLPEKIMSDIIQVDALKNDKLQLLFNTRSSIYMFDRNGNDMKGFPLKLTASATNGIAVFDYEKNKEYRLFLATSDKKITCFKITGEPVKGFNFDATNEQVFVPIQFTEIDGKDHLFVVDRKGKIYVINRQGETKIKLKEKLPQGIKNFSIDVGKNYTQTSLIASDTLGNVVKINLENKKEILKFQDFETSPYFLYQDINNDKIKEYIFLSRNELNVFAQNKSLVFNYQFKSTSNYAPFICKFSNETLKIGVTLDAANELYLFNSNGTLYNQFPIHGKTIFTLSDLNNEGTLNLITGSEDNSIYMYTID